MNECSAIYFFKKRVCTAVQSWDMFIKFSASQFRIVTQMCVYFPCMQHNFVVMFSYNANQNCDAELVPYDRLIVLFLFPSASLPMLKLYVILAQWVPWRGGGEVPTEPLISDFKHSPGERSFDTISKIRQWKKNNYIGGDTLPKRFSLSCGEYRTRLIQPGWGDPVVSRVQKPAHLYMSFLITFSIKYFNNLFLAACLLLQLSPSSQQ